MNEEFSASNNEKYVKDEGFGTDGGIKKTDDKKECSLSQCRKTGFYVVSLCSLVFFQSFIVSGYHSGITTSLEKRFRLSSKNLGSISSTYNIAAIIGTLCVSYLGDNINRARILGLGAILMTTGCIIYATPFYIGDIYTYKIGSNVSESLCLNETKTLVVEETTNTDTNSMIIVIIGFSIIGLGSSPIYNLGLTYLYDNCIITYYPVLSGIAYAMGAFGPACGFIASSFILKIFVNPGHRPNGASVNDKDWIGAWWLGILIAGGVIFIISLMFFTFPKKLPNIARSTGDDDDKPFAGLGKHILEFPHILWQLLKNPTWLFASLGYCCFQVIANGFIRFMGKYIETAYGLPASSASLITGYVLIPPTVIGVILGGVIMAKLKLPVVGITKFLFFLNFVPLVLIGYLMTRSCDTPKLAGVNVMYNGSTSDKYELQDVCNKNCFCSDIEYIPICDPTIDVTYYSPCYAGCKESYGDKKERQYLNCNCAENPDQKSLKSGKCENRCSSFFSLLMVLVFIILFASLGHNPLHLITLRSVEPSYRSFALGMQALLAQLLAFIPSPMIFGTIFDAACILKSPNSSDNLCYEYDAGKLTSYMYGVSLGFQMLAITCFGLCWFSSSFTLKLSSNDDLEKQSSNITIISDGH